MGVQDTGFYSLRQLYSTGETERQKAHIGIFPWGRTKILTMVKAGTFPKPVKTDGKILTWRKEDIHRYIDEAGK